MTTSMDPTPGQGSPTSRCCRPRSGTSCGGSGWPGGGKGDAVTAMLASRRRERPEAALEARKVEAAAAAVAADQRATDAGKEAQQTAVEIAVRAEPRLQQKPKKN